MPCRKLGHGGEWGPGNVGPCGLYKDIVSYVKRSERKILLWSSEQRKSMAAGREAVLRGHSEIREGQMGDDGKLK